MFLSFFVCIFVTVKHKTTITIMAQEIIKTVVENKVSESDSLINKMKEYLPESFFEKYIDNIKHDSFLMNSDTNLAHEGDYVRFVKAFTNNALSASGEPAYRTHQRVTRQIRRHCCRLPLVRDLLTA